MSNARWKASPGVVVGGAALLVVAISLVSILAQHIGVVEPHITIETKPTAGPEAGRHSRQRAVKAVMEGEAARTEERLREATALATAASLYVLATKAGKGSGRPVVTTSELIGGLARERLLPPQIIVTNQKGTLASGHGVLVLRYRPWPLAVEVISIGRDAAEGPALMVRLPGEGLSEDGALIFMAQQLENVTIPRPFAPAVEVIANGWMTERWRPS